MPNHTIAWRGNWRKMTGRIDGKKRFEIQGDGAKYDLHFIAPGKGGKRTIVSAKQKTLTGAKMAAERYATKHLGASASASASSAGSGNATKTYQFPKGHKPDCSCPFCERARAGGASSASAGSRRPRSDAELNKRISIRLTQKQMERVKRAA